MNNSGSIDNQQITDRDGQDQEVENSGSALPLDPNVEYITYEGEFKLNQIHGKGVLNIPGKSKFEGFFH
jgi:hypothetical protein